MYTSNNLELDRIRREIADIPTVRDNYEIRILWLRLWVCFLQQIGMDLKDFLPVDAVFRKHFYWNLSRSPEGKQKSFTEEEFHEISRAIDRGYEVLENVHSEFAESPILESPQRLLPESSISRENVGSENWPLYGGDCSHSATTSNHGPKSGNVSWKFPVGLAWYSRPLIDGNRLIVASPGIRTVLKCFDLDTGKELWRTTQLPDIVGDQLYWSPCHSGTPLLIDDKIYLRDMGSRGNAGITKSVSVFSRDKGEQLKKIDAGHVDYRTGYPPLAGNGRYLVIPQGIHDIHLDPPVAHPFNKIKIYDLKQEKYVFSLNTGHLFGEPVCLNDRAYFGDASGYIYALNLVENIGIDWRFKGDSSMNSSLSVTEDYLIAGSNEGTVYCLDRKNGELLWESHIPDYEENSFRQFSKAFVSENRVFIGSSNSKIIEFDLSKGKISSIRDADDWVRSAPLVLGDNLYVASMKGTISLYHLNGNTASPVRREQASTHQFFSDIVSNGDKICLVDSDLYLSVYDRELNLLWRDSLIDCFELGDRRIFIDQIAGGAYYQSKPTVADGRVYIGSPSRFIYAIDEYTGKEIWKSELGGAVSAAPSYCDTRIYAGQQGGEDQFYCIDGETGRKIWSQSLGWVWGSANIKDGRVFVPCIDGFVSCLDSETGFLKWRYRTAKSTCTEPAVDGDRVFFGGWDEILHAFDVETGRILWQYQLHASSDSGAQIALDGKIFVPSGGNRFRCLDNKTGELIWQFVLSDATFNASPACDGDSVYISVWDGLGMAGIPIGSWIHKLDINSGKKIWSVPGGGLTAPVVANENVYFGSTTSPYFSCVDKESGRILWKVLLGNKVEESCTAISGGQAFILSSDAYLYAIN